jgi:glycosyltransferase involved in cell wall biosynthesis
LNVLFLSYDGMTDPLGPSQVLPYLFGLAKLGHTVHLGSLEKPECSEDEIAAVRSQCETGGIDWHPLRFRSDLPFVGVLQNYRQLRRLAVKLNRERPLDLIHARSYIPALVARSMKHRFGTAFLFDMRGFWPDERVDGGLWPQSNPIFRLVYLYFKRRETELLRDADSIVSLTEAGKAILLSRPDRSADAPSIAVIPCCADLDAFPQVNARSRSKSRKALGLGADRKVVAYLGSTGTWYLLGEMLDFFRAQLRLDPGALFLIVTRDDPRPIVGAARAHGIPPDTLIIRPAGRSEVAELLAAADYGLFFIKPCFSKKASSPTKLGEFLALGLPVVTNSGVGDVDTIIHTSGAGVLVERFENTAYERAIEAISALPREPERWRIQASRWFDLKVGVAAYAGIYDDIANSRDSPHSTATQALPQD